MYGKNTGFSVVAVYTNLFTRNTSEFTVEAGAGHYSLMGNRDKWGLIFTHSGGCMGDEWEMNGGFHSSPFTPLRISPPYKSPLN